MRQKVVIGAMIAATFVLTPAAFAVDPNPLESAYWRFEEGPVDTKVPSGIDTLTDSTVNSNHMRRFTPDPPADFHAPTYRADVPAAVVPGTGATNDYSLYFDGPFGSTPPGGVDIYTDVKNINNPVATAFTLEASFKSDVVGVDIWQAVVCKEGKGGDTSHNEPPFALKITGDGNNLLRMELRDKGNTLRTIDSLATIVANQWYHAAVVATDSEVALYLDELNGEGYVLQGTAPISGGGPLWQGTDGGDTGEDPEGYDTAWSIGKGWYNQALADWFRGHIDEVRLTNEALEPSDFLWYDLGLPGDFNDDNQVDVQDLLIFEACFTGPEIAYDPQDLPEGCTVTPKNGLIAPDMNSDGDVDQLDFGLFQVNIGVVGS